MLQVEHEVDKGVDIIILDGILNADTSPKLESVLNPITESACPRILMHIPDLSYISSAGIGCFIGVIKRIRTKGGDIRFSKMDPRVLRVFKLLDMESFFRCFESLEQGVDSFQA